MALGLAIAAVGDGTRFGTLTNVVGLMVASALCVQVG